MECLESRHGPSVPLAFRFGFDFALLHAMLVGAKTQAEAKGREYLLNESRSKIPGLIADACAAGLPKKLVSSLEQADEQLRQGTTADVAARALGVLSVFGTMLNAEQAKELFAEPALPVRKFIGSESATGSGR